jgi:hypothetical protein
MPNWDGVTVRFKQPLVKGKDNIRDSRGSRDSRDKASCSKGSKGKAARLQPEERVDEEVVEVVGARHQQLLQV